jgi:hypothetical protein
MRDAVVPRLLEHPRVRDAEQLARLERERRPRPRIY